MLFIESGGDNLAATFSPELVDATIYVIDVAEGEKIPRKGGPGITRSDLLVINKIDLAPYVGADLEVMERDAGACAASGRSCSRTSATGVGVEAAVEWIRRDLLFESDRRSRGEPPPRASAARAGSRLAFERRGDHTVLTERRFSCRCSSWSPSTSRATAR